MFEESLLTISNWQQLTHPDTRPDKGREHNNKQDWKKNTQKKGRKNKGRGHKNSRKTDRGGQPNRKNTISRKQ